MKRRHAATLVALAVVLVVWRSAARPAASAERANAIDPTSTRAARAHDPRKSPRGTIRGTVTLAGKPLAGARVCADPVAAPNLPTDAVRDALCTDSDAAGAYAIGELFADDYIVSAHARRAKPATHRGNVRVRAGATVEAIDLALHAGGGELTGTVVDIGGGPVAHAQVRASTTDGDAITETDDRGAFSISLEPGDTRITANADGYAAVTTSASAPGTVELRLVPESSLSGTVVTAGDATPVAGARVSLVGVDWTLPWSDAITDDDGRFEVTRLRPGRYTLTVVGAGATGGYPGSIAVALGEHATGVTVEVYPAFAIEGRVLLPGGEPCADGAITLEDREHARRLDGRADLDGTIHVDGALPGTYHVTVACSEHRALDHYAPIVVTAGDVRGLAWTVEDGATLRGRITSNGTPVEGATVDITGAASASAVSAADGGYRIGGLVEGSYRIHVSTASGLDAAPDDDIEIGEHATVEGDIALQARATVRGIVVDRSGAPATGIIVRTSAGHSLRTAADGTFTLPGLGDGRLRIVALSTAREDGDDVVDARTASEATVELSAGETASVRLVVDAAPAQPITGVVIDADGHPVADAIVDVQSVDAEHLAPLLTGADGTFRTPPVHAGRYAVAARAAGHGDAIDRDVTPGTRVTLSLAPVASIIGHVTGAADELAITLRGENDYRTETFFRAGGAFALRDVPPGRYQLTFESEGGYARRDIDVGTSDTTLDVALTPLVTITGRCVASDTHQPIAGVGVGARSEEGYEASASSDVGEGITDDAGRFMLRRVLAGSAQLRCNGNDTYQSVYTPVQITGGDIGDLPMEPYPRPADEPSGDSFEEGVIVD